MAKKVNNIPKDNNIIRIPLEEAMPDNYLPYAIEVAKDRALPDVRDGLKPVHRRILYGAYMLKAFPDKPYYKSARIVGDILGKYHPHGDSSVYDATVILAQDFSTREPLIDGHGNWGSIDGDGAAAMRYTEARLAPIAMELLKDIEKDTVEMVPNYSDSEMEPKVLPSRYPNLLVNGTFGIAVGLATNIPPHNLEEVTNGVLAYIDNPEITTKELMNYVKGPDLPTGGILIGEKSLLSAYETGEGKVSLRAKTSIERLESGRVGIVITEFPYRRNKARLLQTISEMTGDKKHSKALESISDIRDESDRSGIRAVIELKKVADEEVADKVLKYLLKKTDLQCNINFNMVALANGKPETMGLKTIIGHYVNHRKDVITRRSIKELAVAEKRFHIVEGFIKAINVLDDIIKTIRESKSKKDASTNLIERFGFTEAQAEAILELMLYRLTGLEIKVFEKEYKELEKTIKRLKKILESEKELLKVVKKELEEVCNIYKSPRRTEIIHDDSEAKIDLEELIVVEDVMIAMSKEGFIKRIPLKTYNRYNCEAKDIEYREGDELQFLVQSSTVDSIVFFTESGYMYQTKGVNIPEVKWKEKGEKIDSIIKNLNLEVDRIVGFMPINVFPEDKYLQFVTSKGMIKISSLDKFKTAYTKLQALRMKADESVVHVKILGSDGNKPFINFKTKLGLKFGVQIPKLVDTQRNILGTQLFELASKDEVVSIEYMDTLEIKEFNISLNKSGLIRNVNNAPAKDLLKAKITSLDYVLIFTNRGNSIKLPGYFLESIIEKEMHLSDFVDKIEENEVPVLLKKYPIDKSGYIYFFSKKGMVKKVNLEEFEGNNSYQLAYKFKHENDEIIAVDIITDIAEEELVILTKKGMAIKFLGSSVNPMGKVASGVTGISLKDEDEVIFAKVIKIESESDTSEVAVTKDDIELNLISKNKNKTSINVSNIKLQNRAGRGSNIALLVLDDEVKEVITK